MTPDDENIEEISTQAPLTFVPLTNTDANKIVGESPEDFEKWVWCKG